MNSSGQLGQCNSTHFGPHRKDRCEHLNESAAERAACACYHGHSTRTRRRVCHSRLAPFALCIGSVALVVFFAPAVYHFFNNACSQDLVLSSSSATKALPTNENSYSSALNHSQVANVADDTWAFGGYLRSNCPSDQNPVNEGGSKASGCLQTSATDPENMVSYTFYTAKADSTWAVCLFTSKNCKGINRQGNPFTAKGCISNKSITLSARVIDTRTQTCRSPFK
ncbi:uncharacterized protein FTOL_13668 [Fusarium torulosum]|uniref:Transmembrane protein n=1 Tax=Fusarium torulosum TaxID=33205 RepID=A0AAE8SQF8_9HYPO|nr:uncharacterized protein FTOL_13668 [Fusarium torulosum]